nr:hypothetical protein [Tanacetum cinerariifolium]
MPLTYILLRAILGVLQIGIRAEAIENQVKNNLLDYNHFESIALVKKGLHGTFMHMLVAALVDTIMSDSKDSTVTYTTVSSPYEGRSGDVSPGVDGPPVMPEDPYTYVVAAFQALPLPDYPVYPEYIPPEDDVFPAEEQPMPAAASPTAESPGYIPGADRLEVTLPPRKRLSIVHCPGYEARESLVATAARPIEGRRAHYGFVKSVEAEIRRRRVEDIGYGIRDTWIDPRDVAEEEALTTLERVNTKVTELAAVQE